MQVIFLNGKNSLSCCIYNTGLRNSRVYLNDGFKWKNTLSRRTERLAKGRQAQQLFSPLTFGTGSGGSGHVDYRRLSSDRLKSNRSVAHRSMEVRCDYSPLC